MSRPMHRSATAKGRAILSRSDRILMPTIRPALSSPSLRLMLLVGATFAPGLALAEDPSAAPAAPISTATAMATAAPSAPTAVPPSGASTAACRAPQATRAKPGERWAVDTPSGQAGDWAAWMTEQLAAGRTRFIAVPFMPTGKDSDGSDGPPDNPLQLLCAW